MEAVAASNIETTVYFYNPNIHPIEEYEMRKDVTIAALKKIQGVEVSNPMGAFYCIVKLPVDSAEDFSKFLLTDFEDRGQTVMFAPAAGFYSSPNS